MTDHKIYRPTKKELYEMAEEAAKLPIARALWIGDQHTFYEIDSSVSYNAYQERVAKAIRNVEELLAEIYLGMLH